MLADSEIRIVPYRDGLRDISLNKEQVVRLVERRKRLRPGLRLEKTRKGKPFKPRPRTVGVP